MAHGRWSGVVAGGLVACLLLFFSTCRPAAAESLPDGPLSELPAGQAYLLLSLDSSQRLERLRLDPQRALSGRQELRAVPAGRSVHLLRVPAGRYRFDFLEAAGLLRFKLARHPALPTLDVQAGRLNYAGELQLRFRALSVDASLVNHLEQALQVALGRHPGLDASTVVLAPEGFHDPWPALRPRPGPGPGLAAEPCPDPTTLPRGEPGVGALFRREEVDSLTLAPEGDLVLEVAHRNARHEASVIDPFTGESVLLYAGPLPVDTALWAGPRRVVLGFALEEGPVQETLVHTLKDGDLAGQRPTLLRMALPGVVVDPLPAQPDHMLFGVWRPEHKDRFQVHRVDLTVQGGRRNRLQPRNRIDPALAGDVAWLADRAGRLRAALVVEGERARLVAPDEGTGGFSTLVDFEAGNRLLEPVALDDDGSLLALSNVDREQTELVRIRPEAAGEMETVHSIPGVDLSGVVLEADGRTVVGVRYYAGGQPRAAFFDGVLDGWSARLEATFPERHVDLVEVDRRRGRAILRISSDTRTPVWYLFDQASGTARELVAGAPWLEDVRFVPRRVVEVRTADDQVLQALLATPPGAGPHPLLVMPHGGPFYVQDNLRFDRDVQYWATRGFAVLQVNFRGSYGFGVQHLLDGFGGFGRRIEDDVEAAVDEVLAGHPELDGHRICALGASYGGYSSLALAIRNPARYRCAVARAAPTDLPLLFTSSDWIASPRARQAVVEAVGEPRDPMLQSHSPLYMADRLRVPVLLQHGGRDRRVSYEHAVRLASVLDPRQGHRLVHLPEMGHGASLVAEQACLQGTAETFIRESLSNVRPPSTPD